MLDAAPACVRSREPACARGEKARTAARTLAFHEPIRNPMPDDRLPMTKGGHETLKEELRRLKNEERHKISKEIGIAREHGDLRENAEYHAARNKQSFIEGRIEELTDKLARADVIDTSNLGNDKVVFGATVTLADAESGDVVVYRIVAVDEADLKLHKISVTSPVAKALIGRRLDDTVRVQTPGGFREYEIQEIVFE